MQVQIDQKDIEKIEEIVLDAIASEIFTTSQENLVKEGKVDTGYLLKSGQIVKRKGEREINYDTPYAGFVEFGASPHYPPLKAIEKWVKRKFRTSEKEAKRIAYAVARNMAERGIRPTPCIRNAIDETRAKYKSK